MNDNFEILDAPDGGVLLDFSKKADKQSFSSNLAELLPEHQLNKIGADLKRAIEDDLQSRKEWEEVLSNGLDYLGIKPEEKTYPFNNACGTSSTAYLQGLITFVSSAFQELFPPSGPVKCTTLGESTDEQEKQSDKIQELMNYYLTEIATEYYPGWEQTLLWHYISGNTFRKVFQDPVLQRPIALYIKPQDFIVNFGAPNIELASRLTHRRTLSYKELKLYQQSGYFIKEKIDTNEYDSDGVSDIKEREEEIEGITQTYSPYTKNYTFYESHADLVLDEDENEDGIPKPYICTIDAVSSKVLGLYRNWRKNDTRFKRIPYFWHQKYFPGTGFYGWGAAHLYGSSAKAANDLHRQLIDAGTLSNFPGGLRAKGVRAETNNVRIGPTEFVEIDTGGEPIDKMIMMMPYKPPSEILYNLKKDIENDILQLNGAANQPYADFNPNAPVGTTLALLEQTHRLQSSIIRRLHQGLATEFQMLYTLFSKFLPEVSIDIKFPATRSDFRNSFRILPISDPNINNNTQRLLRAESLLRFAQQNPDIHDLREAYKLVYKELKVPDYEIDRLLLPAPDNQNTPALDPLSENQRMSSNKPVKVFSWQDDDAHITVHQLLGQSDNEQVVSLAQAHIAEHKASKQRKEIQGRLNFTLPEDMSELPPEIQNQIAAQMAQAAQQIQQEQQQADPPPVPPGEAMMKDIEMKTRANDQRAELEQQRIELEKSKVEINAQLKEKELQHKAEVDEEKLRLEQMKITGVAA